jgi:hypothetical protein
MRKDYTIGMIENKISLKVNVGSPGIVHTIAFQFLPGGQYKKLKESNVQSGNIDLTFIGTGAELIGSYLKIRTVIDFGSIDSIQWPQLVNTIVEKAFLSGGFAGDQSYSYDEDDKTVSLDGRIVVIDMEINLKQ